MKDYRKYGCTLLKTDDLGKASIAGFDYVEFMGKYLVSLTEREFSIMRKELEKYSLKVTALNAYCPPEIKMTGYNFSLKSVREYARLCAERAALLGVQFVGIGSPNSRSLPPGYDNRLAMQQLANFLLVTAEEFERFHITVCLEPLAPVYSNFINYIPEAVDLIHKLNKENIRLVIDFYNMEKTKEADMPLKEWLPYIAHAHISDDDGAPNLRSFFNPDKKEIHQQRIRRLYEAGYNGAVTVELDIRMDVNRARNTLQILREA